MLFQVLIWRLRPIVAIGASALAFAAAHLFAEPTGVAGLLVFGLVLSVGMLLAWLLERATLVAPIVTHAVFNLTLLVLVAGGDLAATGNWEPGIFTGETEETGMSSGARPRIARIWRGRTAREKADEYEVYNYEAGVKPLIQKALGVQTFREDRPTETEFITISYWESVEAMSRFTGGDPTRIHHLERDAEFLIELPERVQILDIRTSHGDTGGAPGPA